MHSSGSTKLDQTRPNSTSVAPPFQSTIHNPQSASDDAPTCCGRRRITHKFGNQNCTDFRGSFYVPLIPSHLRRFGNHQRFPAHRPSPLFKVQGSKFKVQGSPPPLRSGAVAPTCPAKARRRRKLRAKAERFRAVGAGNYVRSVPPGLPFQPGYPLRYPLARNHLVSGAVCSIYETKLFGVAQTCGICRPDRDCWSLYC